MPHNMAMRRVPFLMAHVLLTPGVLWFSGGVLATIVNAEFYGIALNILLTFVTMGLALYEGVTGIRKALPFSILILGGIGTAASVIVGFSQQEGPPDLVAVGYLVALMFWMVAHSCIMIRTNVPKLANNLWLNPLAYYNIGNILSIIATPLASLCFALGIVRSYFKKTPASGWLQQFYEGMTPERWAGFGYSFAALLSLTKAPIMAAAFLLWGLGYFCLERDKNLSCIGLRMPRDIAPPA